MKINQEKLRVIQKKKVKNNYCNEYKIEKEITCHSKCSNLFFVPLPRR